MDRGDKILMGYLVVTMFGLIAISVPPSTAGLGWWAEVKSAGGLIGGVATFVSVFAVIGLEYRRRWIDRREIADHCRHIAIHCLHAQSVTLSASVREFLKFFREKGLLAKEGTVSERNLRHFALRAIRDLEMEELRLAKDKAYFVSPQADTHIRNLDMMRQVLQQTLNANLAITEGQFEVLFPVGRMIEIFEKTAELLGVAVVVADSFAAGAGEKFADDIAIMKTNYAETMQSIVSAKSMVGLSD